MGSIVVGKKKQKIVDMGGVTIVPNSGAKVEKKEGMAAEVGKVQEVAREKRLAEIMTLPANEQLPILLKEGFTEEAQKLSEQLAKEQQEHTDDGTGEENVGGEAAELNETGGEAENAETAAEPEKKKGGLQKKTESK